MRINREVARKKIEDSGFRMRFLAEKIMIQPETLRLYVNGHSRPSRGVVTRLAQILGCSAEELILSEKRQATD